MESSEVLSAVEAVLASHRGFGDSNYIHDQMHVVFKRRLKRIAGSLPDARRLLDALDDSDADTVRRVLGDMVLRCAIQHALWGIELGWQRGLARDRCAELFRETTALLERGYKGAPIEYGATRPDRLGVPSHLGWVWNNDHADDPYFRAFRELIHQNYRGYLCSPSAEELATLRQGAQLLSELMPLLCRSALSHTQIIGVFPQDGQWKGGGSSSQFRLTGTIFLDRESLTDPWWVVEHLLHESLHQKLYDFRHGHTLFEPRDETREVHTICSPWNSFGGSNQWDAFRAFAAFHVYVHLALLAAMIEQRPLKAAEGPEDRSASPIKVISSRKAIERARYLGHSLETTCWDELGVAGKRFHKWLTSVLDVLDPSPPREGAYIHLLLDLYRNEANRVRSAEGADEMELSALLAEEVEATRSLLSGLAAFEGQVNRFNAAVSEHLDSGKSTAQERFYWVRTHVSETILGLCRDGHHIDTVPGLADPNETVWKMVQRSSERTGSLLARRAEAVTSLVEEPTVGTRETPLPAE